MTRPGVIIEGSALTELVGRWMERRRVWAPVRVREEVHFQQIADPREVDWKYSSTVIPPSKLMHKSQVDMVRFVREGGQYRTDVIEAQVKPSILLAVHPCDLHGIMVIERTLAGKSVDPWYEAERRQTLIVGLNCQSVSAECFCASYGTGPFYSTWMEQGPPAGCDVLLTDLGDRFLVEAMSDEGAGLLEGVRAEAATSEDISWKAETERTVRGRFKKRLQVAGLPELLMRNLEHPIWERVGEGRCLSCSNCTMVCPTCYCYDVTDEAELDLAAIVRRRRWDSCQDYHFAEVHFGNFRLTRKSRLRQFVCHKLSYWVEQHGCFGCIGCGRCIRWCPTGIDLTEIAGEVRLTEVSPREAHR